MQSHTKLLITKQFVCFLLLLPQTSTGIVSGGGASRKAKNDTSDSDLAQQFLQSQTAPRSSLAIASSKITGDSTKSSAFAGTFSGEQKCPNCVKYYLCQNEAKGGPLVEGLDPESLGLTPGDFLGLLDIRQEFNPCPHYFDVCCEVRSHTLC
jgi:hypothetical protein